MSKFYQKGVSLYLTIIIMVILLAIVLGVSAILLGQLKTIKGMENSVVAFYAAETGIEEALNDIYDGSWESFPYPSDVPLGKGAFYNVMVVCCDSSDAQCEWTADECSTVTGLSSDSNCPASYLCVDSVGTYRETKRAIRTTIK